MNQETIVIAAAVIAAPKLRELKDSPVFRYTISESIRTLVLCLNLALISAAQQSSPTTATAPPEPLLEQIRSTVAFLTVTYQDGSNVKGVVGTGFFIGVVDTRLGENKGFIYLVTNRHVAQPGIELGTTYPVSGVFIRLNLLAPREGIQLAQEQITLGNEFHWLFPQDEAVDLAIMRIAPDQKIFSYRTISSGLIATSEQVKKGDIAVGDRVVFAGFFSSFPGQNRNEPIVRQGVIAMLPDETVRTTLNKPGQVYLAVLHAFHGNSGSPVLVNVGGTPHHGLTTMGDDYRLLGLISGYYPEAAGFSVPAATVLTGQVHDNSGIATIVPADELNKLLNSAEVQADRDRYVASVKTKKP
jgi:hypothetical protein